MSKKYKLLRPVVGFEGLYEVSSLGEVISVKVGRPLKQMINEQGYCVVSLFKDGRYKSVRVHRLVAIAFIPNPQNKPEVNHKYGIKNDNRVSELEWSTSFENNRHAFSTGIRKWSDKSKSLVSASRGGKPFVAMKGGKEFGGFVSYRQCEIQLGITIGCVSRCLMGLQAHCHHYTFRFI